MQVLGITTGPEVEPDPLVDSIADRLAERGRVGVVRSGTVNPDADDRTEFTVGESNWAGSGSELDVRSILDRLSRTHEYAILVGFPERNIPQVVVGETKAAEEVFSVDHPDSLAIEDILDAIEAAEPFETLESLVDSVKRSPEAEYAGAIATFTGRVRAKEHEEDSFTESLEFEQYDAVAEDRMAALQADLTDREDVLEVELHHRTGRIEYGEDIVFVVVLAGHRDAAFETVEDGINRLKEEVPIFKKEVTVEEEFWVHERS
ncbi:MAG: molybdopterin synthase [Halodesulfurarchaeum sp.]